MIFLPCPPVPAPIVVAQRHRVGLPAPGSLYQARPIHGGYRDGRPAPTVRWGAAVEVIGGSNRDVYFREGNRVRAMPVGQFYQRFAPYVPGR